MVVKAGVMPGHPADEPGLDLGLVDHLLEDALRGIVADEVGPPGGVGGEALYQRPQCVDVEFRERPSRISYKNNRNYVLPSVIVLSPKPPSTPISCPVM